MLAAGHPLRAPTDGPAIKKKTFRPAELNRPDIREARTLFLETISQVAHHRLIFVDESGAKTNMSRLYGRGPRGVRVYDHIPHGRWETTTMIAAVGRNGPQAPWVLEGPMDGPAFQVWVERVLVQTLQPTDIVIMDNLSVHRNAAACAAIRATGAELWPHPPYSHDLNPIEKMWSKIKAYLRKVKARDPESLCQAVGQAMERVTKRDVRNWFASCGYSFI